MNITTLKVITLAVGIVTSRGVTVRLRAASEAAVQNNWFNLNGTAPSRKTSRGVNGHLCGVYMCGQFVVGSPVHRSVRRIFRKD
jgi:hypothetical protein